MKTFKKSFSTFILFILSALVVITPSAADDNLNAAVQALFGGGKPHIHLRYRYEHVDDDLVPANDAHASTLRAVVGYETGSLKGFSFYAEMEHIAQLFTDDYREGGFDAAKAGRFPIVADPPGTELNQAWVRFNAGKGVDIKVGRQDLTYRKAPFHRFIGNILWRQNWQTYDAVSLKAQPLEKMTINVAYIDQVNRIFGEDAPGPANRFECDCYLFNGQYGGFKYVNLEAYAYLLDIDNAAVNSTDTFGFRANGAIPLNDTFKVIYAGEFATQSDSDSNPRAIDADYYLAELGLGVNIGQAFLKNLVVKFDYEVLEGDGRGSFITPLSTAHAFQGWADRFLVTPLDGIEDFYITAVGNGVFGGKMIISYHMLGSDNLSYDYGEELNILYARKVKKYFSIGTKAAIYSADRNATALARAGGVQNNDVTKVWVWAQFDY